MKTLFLDTHSKLLSVALITDRRINLKEKESINSHAVLLLPLIDSLLKEENTKVENIDQIIVINGPGSFTGIRVGLSVAKTMGYAKNIDVYPVSSLIAYLISSDIQENKMAVIEDNKGYYIAAADKFNNILIEEKYEEILENYNYKLVAPTLNINKILNFVKTMEPIKINELKANYIKKIGVEL